LVLPMTYFSFNDSRFLFLFGGLMAVAFAGCAGPSQVPGPRTAAGVWQVRLPESTSPIASKAHGVPSDDTAALDARGGDSIAGFLRKDAKGAPAPSAHPQGAVAHVQVQAKQATLQAPPAALPPPPEPQQLVASAAPAQHPATSELERYGERDAQAQQAQTFRGGDAVIIISATTLIIILLVILIIVLID
jgi:hypothetical protein